MEMIKVFLEDLLARVTSRNILFKRNLLKEYLQIVVLDYIYSHPAYSNLVFYGGSCLSHCFGLNRLSEDIDFIDIKKEINISQLAEDIKGYFNKNTDIKIKTSIQKFRIYLKFPVLKELNLAEPSESDLLFLKVKVFKEFRSCKDYKIQFIPVMRFNKSIIIKTFDLSTLMATKIMAILHRKWEKTDKNGRTIIKVKGRDYFDLLWYLKKGIIPNIRCIEGIKTKEELKKKLLKIVEDIDQKSIQLDLEQFIESDAFIKSLSKNIKEILLPEIEAKL